MYRVDIEVSTYTILTDTLLPLTAALLLLFRKRLSVLFLAALALWTCYRAFEFMTGIFAFNTGGPENVVFFGLSLLAFVYFLFAYWVTPPWNPLMHLTNRWNGRSGSSLC